MNRRQITGYIPWQVWDFTLDRGLALLLVGGLLGMAVLWPAYVGLSQQMSPDVVRAELFKLALSQHVSIMVVVAASGIVSTDRINGYYRFVFAKPVRMPAYYALQFLVTLVGLLLVTLVLLSAFWLFFGWVSPAVALAMVIATFLALGGTIFFFSTFTRFDWGMLVVLWGASALSRTLAGDSAWYGVLRWVLPPTHQIDNLRGALLDGTPIDGAGAAWLVGYGLAFLAAGLVVLHRKAIAE